MPQSQCTHSVDFDKFEIVHLKKYKHTIRVDCPKCHRAITLGDVLESLTKKIYNLNERLLQLEPPPEHEKEASDGESVPDSGS